MVPVQHVVQQDVASVHTNNRLWKYLDGQFSPKKVEGNHWLVPRQYVVSERWCYGPHNKHDVEVSG